MQSQHGITLCVAQGSFSQSICGGQIKITNTQNQETVTARIADECPTCDAQSLDLSVGAFTKIATEQQGEVPSACLSCYTILRPYLQSPIVVSWTVVSL